MVLRERFWCRKPEEPGCISRCGSLISINFCPKKNRGTTMFSKHHITILYVEDDRNFLTNYQNLIIHEKERNGEIFKKTTRVLESCIPPPPKTNMEGTKMMGLGKVTGPFKHSNFLVSMLDFWGVPFLSFKIDSSCFSLPEFHI